MPKSNVSPKPTSKSSAAKASNFLRTLIFLAFVALLCSALYNSIFNNNQTKLETVPLSSVISRANDQNGNIKKITVEGNKLKITLKDKDQPTEESYSTCLICFFAEYF